MPVQIVKIMTQEELKNQNVYSGPNRIHYKNGRTIAGIILVLVGGAFLARQMGLDLPQWLFDWPMFLIVLGIFIGAKHNFRKGGWWIVSLVGVVFLVNHQFPGITHLFWPLVIILVGLVFIFRPRGRAFSAMGSGTGPSGSSYGQDGIFMDDATEFDSGDVIDSTSIFGGNKKIILSKDFKGGEITCIFGGTELNLMQADINGRVVLEVTQVFGGTKLLVPANWEVLSDMVAIFGGIEDKRLRDVNMEYDKNKVLMLKGTSIFGGIDIRSY